MSTQNMQEKFGFELAHIGINTESPEEAKKVADRLALFLGMPIKDGNSSMFVGGAAEVMKKKFLGANGHIAVRTNDIDGAVEYLETELGFVFDRDTAVNDDKGLRAIYLNEEIGGFAVHLVRA